MTTYVDHSAVIIGDSQQAMQAQQSLMALGIDLGPSGADGHWGDSSRAAAAQWQEINGYEATGDITERQMDALAMQAEHPSMFHRMQLEPFYENFDQNLITTDDPVRRATVLQAASHIGAIESGGNNLGPAVEQYFEADDRLNTGAAWCAAFGSWGIDQVENHAGLNNSDYMEGNMRVRERLHTTTRRYAFNVTPRWHRSLRNGRKRIHNTKWRHSNPDDRWKHRRRWRRDSISTRIYLRKRPTKRK